MTKICTKCRNSKDLLDFNRSSATRDGHRWVCRQCERSIRESAPKPFKRQKKLELLLIKGGKNCTNCLVFTSISDFYKIKSTRDGLMSWCKTCVKQLTRKRYKDNPKREQEYQRKYRSDNPDKIINLSKSYYQENKQEINAYGRQYCLDHKEAVSAYHKRYWTTNKDKIKKRMQLPEVRQKTNFRQNERRRTDIQCRLSHDARSRRYHALKYMKATKHCGLEESLGCTLAEWKQYLGDRMPINKETGVQATWDDFMATPTRLNIDEIIPCTAWDLTDPVQYKLCFHYTNSRFMWAGENKSKGGANRNREYYRKLVAEKIKAVTP